MQAKVIPIRVIHLIEALGNDKPYTEYFRTKLPVFGGLTCSQLVEAGRREDLIRYLSYLTEQEETNVSNRSNGVEVPTTNVGVSQMDWDPGAGD
jgi:hypothetical protein